MEAAQLRDAFSTFWGDRGHQVRESASLIPHESSLLFTVAGMVPFMPYFLGEETPPTTRLCTVQK
ncbi:MAG: alanine--tRNA ligase-related protein, partial [Acidimicrobiales bacterium]|nr:alanine--tRNA ligase-related protein [Acidimicrobiales bacterium]